MVSITFLNARLLHLYSFIISNRYPDNQQLLSQLFLYHHNLQLQSMFFLVCPSFTCSIILQMNNYQKKLYKYLGFLNDLTINVYMKTMLKNHSTPYSLDEFQLRPESELGFYSLDVSVIFKDFEPFLDTFINRFRKRMDKFEADSI